MHQWAIDDPDRRFDDLFNLVCDPAVLVVAWARVRGNRGKRAAGVDGLRPESILAAEEEFLPQLRHDLKPRQVPDDPPPGNVRYVTDAREGAARARAAAGDADVVVMGAGAAQALLRAGQLDELELHVVPVLLGQGRRLFDNQPPEHVELELVRSSTPADVDPAQRVTHMRYRVHRP